MNSKKSLNETRTGETVYVDHIIGNNETSRRIMEMGLTRGVKVLVKKLAPLGDPIEIEFRGCCLSIGKNEARNILTTKI